MDLLGILRLLYDWVYPANLSYLFVDLEAGMFIPILAYGWLKGWWGRLPFHMNRFLGLEQTCPNCHEVIG